MSWVPDEVREAAARVRVLVLDVDGVLTDGRLHYAADGEALKVFNVRDGLGIRLLILSGIDVAVITARSAPALARRMQDLQIPHVMAGRDDKATALAELTEQVGIPAEDMAYVGDDVLDLPVLRRVGLPITVADGHPLVRREARWVTQAQGGFGAVREVCDGLLAARGQLQSACEQLFDSHVGTGDLSRA